MPKLYIFVTCEKVITSREGQSSLIALFNELTVSPPEDMTSIPSDAVAPREWSVFTSWEKEPEDEGKEYLQAVQFIYPDGTYFGKKTVAPYKIQADKTHQQFTINAPGFPIGQQGMYTVKMWLELNGEIVVGPSSVKINVKHNRPPTLTG